MTAPTIAARSSARLLILLSPALLAAVAIGVGVILAATTLASAPALLIDAGPVVDIALPVCRIIVDLASAVTIGALVLAATALPVTDAPYGRVLDVAAGSAALWAISALGTSVLAYMNLAGAVPWSIFGASYGQFLTEVSLGQGWLATVLSAAVLAVLGFAVRSPIAAGALAAAAFAALIPMALQGHAAGAGSHSAATSALWMHAAGAALWVGGLAVTAVVLGRMDVDRGNIHRRDLRIGVGIAATGNARPTRDHPIRTVADREDHRATAAGPSRSATPTLDHPPDPGTKSDRGPARRPCGR